MLFLANVWRSGIDERSLLYAIRRGEDSLIGAVRRVSH